MTLSEARATSHDGPALCLELVENVEGRDRLPVGVLSCEDGANGDLLDGSRHVVSDGVEDSLTHPLDTAPPSESPDGRLGDAKDDISLFLLPASGLGLASVLAFSLALAVPVRAS